MGGEQDFDLVAASLRSSSGDLKTFVEVLAEKLERALPGRAHVERRRAGMLSRERRVERIEVDLGDGRYRLDAQAGRVEARRATVVRGVVLKTEALGVDDWIDAVARELSSEAERSEESRQALERLLST